MMSEVNLKKGNRSIWILPEVETEHNRRMAAQEERVTELKRQVEEVKVVMSDNVARVLERGDRLDNLDSRAEALQQSSQSFKTTAHRVRRNFCVKNLKWTIILSIFVTLIVIIAIVLILKACNAI